MFFCSSCRSSWKSRPVCMLKPEQWSLNWKCHTEVWAWATVLGKAGQQAKQPEQEHQHLRGHFSEINVKATGLCIHHLAYSYFNMETPPLVQQLAAINTAAFAFMDSLLALCALFIVSVCQEKRGDIVCSDTELHPRRRIRSFPSFLHVM